MIVAAASGDARHSQLIDRLLPPYNRPHDAATARLLPTAFSDHWACRERELGERAADLAPKIVEAIIAGRGHEYVPFAGQSVGLIHDIRPAHDIVERTIAEAERILLNLAADTGPAHQSAGCGVIALIVQSVRSVAPPRSMSEAVPPT